MWNVSRRTLMKQALATGGAAVLPRFLEGCDDADIGPGDPRPIERRTLHFDLTDLRRDVTHVLEVGLNRYVLEAHDQVVRVDDEIATHFAEGVAFPADALQSFIVSYGLPGSDLRAMSLAGLHVPQAAYVGAQAVAPVPATDDLFDIQSTREAARWAVFHHPEIISLDPVAAVLVLRHLDASEGLADLAKIIRRLGAALRPGEGADLVGWARGVPTVDPVTGEQQYHTPDNGKPVAAWHYELHEDVVAGLLPVVGDVLTRIRDDQNLENRRYFTNSARETLSEPLPDTPPPLLKGPPTAAAYQFALTTEAWDSGVCVHDVSGDDQRNVSFTVSNTYYRHVGVSVAFEDASGKIMTLAEAGVPGGVTEYFKNWDTDYLQFLGLVDPPPWLLGLPIPGLEESRLRLEVPMPEKARNLLIVPGSLGAHRGDESLRSQLDGADRAGRIVTYVMEYGVPTVALAAGAAMTAQGWSFLRKELAIIALKVGLKVAPALAGNNVNGPAIGAYAAGEVFKALVATGGTAFAVWAGILAAGTATKALPIVGFALYALDVADAVHAMLRTTLDFARAKNRIVRRVSSTNAVRVRAKSGSVTGFAKTGTSWRLLVTPSGGNTLVATGAFDPIATPAEFEVTIGRIPSGGDVLFTMEVRSCSGWVAASYSGKFLNIVPAGSSEALVEAVLENKAIPIDETTRYSPRARIGIDPAANAHVIVTDTKTPEVGAIEVCAGGAEKICEPAAITFDSKQGVLAYAWQSAQAAIPVCGGGAGTGGTATWSLQNLNLNVRISGGAPDASLRSLDCGVLRRAVPVYGLIGPCNYIVDGSTGVCHLREINATLGGDPDFRKGSSWGRFSSANVKAGAVYKNGTVMIAAGEGDKLEVLVPERSPSDAVATSATMCSGSGSNRGNVRDVVAIAAAYEGDAFLVLENGNQRIQAFGTNGEVIPGYFTLPGKDPSPFLELPKNRRYRDIGVELVSGMIYVLSFANDGSQIDDYQLAIYDRKKGLLATTRGFVASKMTLDHEQNVYSLGFEQLRFRGRREPGVCLWIPTTPPGELVCP